ncbi:hypothetical protein J7L00_03460 [Candidatus Bathyarchaeota archaeon]|nr:hypothetical protein [Candidatus Bathyarchaeota archaeon]
MPIKSKIMKGLDYLAARKKPKQKLRADVFLVTLCDVKPHPYAISLLRALAPLYGYEYKRGMIILKDRKRLQREGAISRSKQHKK